MPPPNIRPPMKTTFLGPKVSFILPPEIIVIGPTKLAIVKTMARFPGFKLVPLMLLMCSAKGGAKTLHAYKEPMQIFIKQLIAKITHLFLLNSICKYTPFLYIDLLNLDNL